MDILTLKAFFMWCTIINFGIAMLSFLMCAFMADWIYKMHSKWFPIPRDTFNAALYSFVLIYKIMFLMFNLVPYVALVILG